MKSNLEAENMIAFLIKNDICATFFDPKKHEQMIRVTEFGKEIHEVLMHMIKTDNMEKLDYSYKELILSDIEVYLWSMLDILYKGGIINSSEQIMVLVHNLNNLNILKNEIDGVR